MQNTRRHVHEAGFGKHVREGEGRVKVYAQCGEAGGDVVPEVNDGVRFGESVVEALGAVVDLLELEPGAGFEVATLIMSALSLLNKDRSFEKERESVTYRRARFMSFGQSLMAITVWREWM